MKVIVNQDDKKSIFEVARIDVFEGSELLRPFIQFNLSGYKWVYTYQNSAKLNAAWVANQSAIDLTDDKWIKGKISNVVSDEFWQGLEELRQRGATQEEVTKYMQTMPRPTDSKQKAKDFISNIIDKI